MSLMLFSLFISNHKTTTLKSIQRIKSIILTLINSIQVQNYIKYTDMYARIATSFTEYTLSARIQLLKFPTLHITFDVSKGRQSAVQDPYVVYKAIVCDLQEKCIMYNKI